MSVISLQDRDFTIKNNELYLISPNTRGTPGILLIHANWCGHCQKFKPLFKQLSERLGNGFKTVELEHAKFKDNKQLVSALDFKYFPTLKFFDQKGKIVGTYDDSNGRDVKDIMKYICDMYHHCILYH